MNVGSVRLTVDWCILIPLLRNRDEGLTRGIMTDLFALLILHLRVSLVSDRLFAAIRRSFPAKQKLRQRYPLTPHNPTKKYT